jgi:hypothetical protein
MNSDGGVTRRQKGGGVETDQDLPQSREELVRFIDALSDSFDPNSVEWENVTVADYLIGCAGWLHDAEGAYMSVGQPMPASVTWALVARMLRAGTIYE